MPKVADLLYIMKYNIKLLVKYVK